MTALWKKNTDSYESSAKVVDGNLIISLPDAMTPVVWRMELGSVKASALEVRTNASDGTFVLSLKTPKGDVHDVAPFDSKDIAVRALMRVSNALQGAAGRMSAPVQATGVSSAQEIPSRPAISGGAGPASFKWLIALVGVIVVIFLFSQMSTMARQYALSGGSQQDTSAANPSGTASGVPLSAEDELRGF